MPTTIPLMRAIGFRIAVSYFSLFVLVSIAAGLGLNYILSNRLMQVQDNFIWRDAAMLSAVYHQNGRMAAVDFVNRRTALNDGTLLRLSDGLGQVLAGNLKNLPPPETTRQYSDDWLEFSTDNGRYMRGRVLPVDADLVLLIAHDITDTRLFIQRMERGFVALIFLLIVLGMLAALAMGRANVRRITRLNDSLWHIMQGNIQARMPLDKKGHEFDALATQINSTLDRIGELMGTLRQVTDNLAHDLRQPLTRLRTRLERMDDTPSTQAALDDIDGVLAGFAALLSLSRLESGIAKDRRRATDIAALLDDMAALYAPAFEDAGMQLVAEKPDVPTLMADRDLLAQALINLLENALRYAATGKTCLTAKQDGDMVHIIISDEGPGINPSDYDRVQQRFVRFDTSRNTPGHGLGLSLVVAIAKAHNGTVQMRPNTPKGLVVCLILPFNASPDIASPSIE